MAGLGSPPQSPTPLQGSYCPGGAGPSTAPTGGSDTSTPAQCPAHTTSPAGSSTSTACLPVPGYYGPAGQAAQICPAVRALARKAPAGGWGFRALVRAAAPPSSLARGLTGAVGRCLHGPLLPRALCNRAAISHGRADFRDAGRRGT